MKYLKTDTHFRDAECSADALKPSELLHTRLAELQSELEGLPADTDPRIKAKLLLDSGYILLDLERKEDAWLMGREAFDLTVPVEDWEQAVQACDIMYQAEQEESIKALMHGIWLGVTYPIDPELTVAMLQHMVDETPPDADGAAVAAVSARFVADMRAKDKKHDDLMFFTGQLLADVARRHSNVDEQEVFDFWMDKLELKEPDKFLPRLSQMIDALVPEGEWWIDRDALRAKLPG